MAQVPVADRFERRVAPADAALAVDRESPSVHRRRRPMVNQPAKLLRIAAASEDEDVDHRAQVRWVKVVDRCLHPRPVLGPCEAGHLLDPFDPLVERPLDLGVEVVVIAHAFPFVDDRLLKNGSPNPKAEPPASGAVASDMGTSVARSSSRSPTAPPRSWEVSRCSRSLGLRGARPNLLYREPLAPGLPFRAATALRPIHQPRGVAPLRGFPAAGYMATAPRRPPYAPSDEPQLICGDHGAGG
jgi:hypothetical protein